LKILGKNRFDRILSFPENKCNGEQKKILEAKKFFEKTIAK
jgi:hypothetical protein